MAKLNHIAGEWQAVAEPEPNINPSDVGDTTSDFTRGTAAGTALRGWSLTSPQVRADLLDHVGAALLARLEEIGEDPFR